MHKLILIKDLFSSDAYSPTVVVDEFLFNGFLKAQRGETPAISFNGLYPGSEKLKEQEYIRCSAHKETEWTKLGDYTYKITKPLSVIEVQITVNGKMYGSKHTATAMAIELAVDPVTAMLHYLDKTVNKVLQEVKTDIECGNL